jgi:DHA2 family multidrug resistance protein-like MFS transporter
MLATELTVASAPPDRSGAASGILETSAELGGALGIALLGSLGGAVYRDAVTTSGLAGVPDQVGQEAGDTLAGGVSAAARLPEPLGTQFADAAREAFVLGFRVTEIVGAGILAALAVATLVLFRRPELRSLTSTADSAPEHR